MTIPWWVILPLVLISLCAPYTASSSSLNRNPHPLQRLLQQQQQAISSAGSNSQPRNSFISGGSLASTNEFPFIVSVQYIQGSTSSHFCGGSIIAPNLIMTAGEYG